MGIHSFPITADWEPYLCTLVNKLWRWTGLIFLVNGMSYIYIFFGSPAADYLYDKNCLTVLTEFTMHLD